MLSLVVKFTVEKVSRYPRRKMKGRLLYSRKNLLSFGAIPEEQFGKKRNSGGG